MIIFVPLGGTIKMSYVVRVKCDAHTDRHADISQCPAAAATTTTTNNNYFITHFIFFDQRVIYTILIRALVKLSSSSQLTEITCFGYWLIVSTLMGGHKTRVKRIQSDVNPPR